ncbi:MAG: DUF134 domain-containing protein [Lachnospiraceae bacterium]|jgi:predicted DNA-binding protein (UPF0251 family)/predicted Fe-Mo cluster-binding NifX family protein
MARPTKCRRVCHFPEFLEFSPTDKVTGEPIILTIDEFETIRLIDKEELSQEECGAQLGVGRTTAQNIYDRARKKIAEALVVGLPLKIEGGDYHLCNGNTDFCYKDHCLQKQLQTNILMKKGENIMRIAVTYENGTIFQHFGHTEQFKVYDVEDGKIIKTEIFDTNGSGHGALAGVLSALKADVLICGGIGGGAQIALAEAGIKLYGGVSGNADDAVNALISGNLNFDPDVHCNHHDQEHGDAAHACGEHGCGHGHCGDH